MIIGIMFLITAIYSLHVFYNSEDIERGHQRSVEILKHLNLEYKSLERMNYRRNLIVKMTVFSFLWGLVSTTLGLGMFFEFIFNLSVLFSFAALLLNFISVFYHPE